MTFDYLLEVVKSSVIPLIISLIISSLIPLFITKRADKKLSEVKNKLDRTLETHKVKLGVEFNTFGQLIEEIYNLTVNVSNILPESICYIWADDAHVLFDKNRKEMRNSIIWVRKRLYILSPYLNPTLVKQCKKLLGAATDILKDLQDLTFEQIENDDNLKEKIKLFIRQGEFGLESIQEFSRNF